jgi:N-carbamoylputrescine amidase
MSRIIKAGLIQAHNVAPTDASIEQIKKANLDHQMKFVEDAAKQGVQMLCFQEIFTNTVLFAPSSRRGGTRQSRKFPDGPTVKLMQDVAKQHGMVLVVPIYEEEQTGIYYNSAAVIDADGKYLGKYRKTHIPHVAPGFWEKFYFRPGNLGYPCFDTAFGRIGVYICYDRHFPEGARCLGLNGAEIIFNPSATVAGLSEYLWKLEQPAHAVANGYFVGAINRVGQKLRGTSVSFTGRVTSAIRAVRSSPKRRVTKTSSSSPISTWTRSARFAIRGSSFEIAGPMRTARSSQIKRGCKKLRSH